MSRCIGKGTLGKGFWCRASLYAAMLLAPLASYAHDTVRLLSLEECLVYAREYSAQALQAKLQFLTAHWRYSSYRAQFLPTLRLSASLPEFNRRLVRYQLADGAYSYVSENANSMSLGMQLSQRVPYTGSNLYIRSHLERVDILGEGRRTSYLSVPVQIGLQHDLFALSTMKWERRIEPQRYLEAKQTYVQTLEQISLEAIELYFNQLYAQQHLAIARLNQMNADTLYRIATGRYNIGTIAENDLLQMELNLLNASHAVNEGLVQLQMATFRLRTYLGLSERYEWEAVVPGQPQANDSVSYDAVLPIALAQSPELLARQREVLEAQRGIAKARSEMGYSASLSLSYGLTQQAVALPGVYTNPQDQQGVRLGISIPILDWGQGRGRLRLAKSECELARLKQEKAVQTFSQDLFLYVMRYNLQGNQLTLAAKADTIAQNRYRVTKARFLAGKVDVLDLDKAQGDRDAARMAFVRAIHTYWHIYYTLRAAALYDPHRREELGVDFDELMR